MKKIVCILLALSMMLTMLAACNNEPVEDVENPNDQQQEDIDPNEKNDDESVLPETVDIVVDGKSDYVIVRGENAYISEVTASTELQSYIKQMTGVEIPIVTDSVETVEKEIVVGKTNRESDGEFDRTELGDDGLVIKTNGQKLFLVGGEQRGTLYAVYTFLEEYLGCRFYLPEVEKVPRVSTISIEQISEDKQIPVFEFRQTSGPEYDGLIRAKRKLNTGVAAEYGGSYGWVRWCHTFDELVPPSVYLSEHPEYYNATYAEEGMGQPCLTNPEVLQIAIENTRNILKNYTDPSYKVISITQNDNQDYCACDNCMALCEAEGSLAAATLQFTNEIATALKEEFPNMLFETFAYQYTRNAPKTIKPAENVVVRICTIEECFSHPIGVDADRTNSSDALVKNTFLKDMNDWSAICDKMQVWDYTVNYTHYQAPFPNFNVLLANARYFADSNVIGIYEEGHYETRGAEFNELRLYLISKVLWDPYMTEDEYQYHINDFLEGVYGEGWTYIREYFDMIHEGAADNCFGTFADVDEIFDFEKAVEIHKQNEFPEDLTSDMIRNYESVDWSRYWNFFRDIPGGTPEFITKGYELFDKAYEAAETEQQKNMIEKISLQVDYVESIYMSKRLSYGGSALGKIILNYINAHPDDFTDQEKTDFRIGIVKLSRQQAYAKVAEFNQKLRDAYVKHGIKCIYLDYSTNIATDELDLTQTPNDWFVKNN